MAIASDIRSQHPAVLLLRFTVAGLMLFHGVAKLTHGVGPIRGLLEQAGLPAWLAFGVLIGEIVAPLFVLAGVWVRWAALIIVVNMVFAIGLAHRGDLLQLTPTGAYRLEAQAFFLFCSLSIAWLAGGRGARR
ncbi:MAG TPA: DoxX family protein [Burkholderiaceae bacterium]|nr:DoxX family protein [Burkholderiaceae bacterium]